MQVEATTIENKDKVKNSACGCGSGGCGSHSNSNEPSEVNTDLPSRFQLLQLGDRVVELGSGLGSDCISAASVVGPTGKVIGIDISEQNISTARGIVDSMKVSNVEFRLGDVEAVPLPSEFANVVYASCVFNLQANKQKVADEMYRICDHNGYVCVSDFVIINDIPDDLRKEASTFAGCIAGAEKADVFMSYFQKTGFTQGGIVEVNKLELPLEILEKYLDADMIKKYNDINSDEGVFSVVLVVEKPETCQSETCCHNADKHKN